MTVQGHGDKILKVFMNSPFEQVYIIERKLLSHNGCFNSSFGLIAIMAFRLNISIHSIKNRREKEKQVLQHNFQYFHIVHY